MRFLLAFWVLASLSTIAQNVTHTHATAPADIIDGSKNPELIPDNVAWRLWLLSVTSKDSKHPELDQRRQDAYLMNAGFEEADLPVARQVVYDFKVAYNALVADHNSAGAAGKNPSLVDLRIRRDSLINQTQARLLSVKLETAEKVTAFINGEKRRMRVAKTEVQP